VLTAGTGIKVTDAGAGGAVTLAINDSVVATLSGARYSGSVFVTGSVGASTGFSGSLTRLADGTSYLIAGPNVTITSASAGVTISSFDSGADRGAQYVVLQSTGSLTNERVLTSGSGISITDNGAGNGVTLNIVDSVVATVSGTTFTGNIAFEKTVTSGTISQATRANDTAPQDIFIQPASGDAGGALGVAYLIWFREFQGKRTSRMEHAYYGPEYGEKEIEAALRESNLPSEKLPDDRLIETVAKLMEGENVIGWFQGRMEYGPRALGNRSIIADARNKENWKKVNLKIKFRESFRPFAPTVLAERTADYFALDRESPYMLLVADVHPGKRREIPAVTHVDGSARIQTISATQNPRYHRLIAEFEKNTGCGVIINTSFNVRGEPIVESPKDAINCFLHTQMDFLVLGNCVVRKDALTGDQQKDNKEYLKKFELD
ncbi:MAG: hypothetical protein UY85_C0043G0007, partial [Candidatus Peribacteria bacterium GW2011_GWB1_54_5]